MGICVQASGARVGVGVSGGRAGVGVAWVDGAVVVVAGDGEEDRGGVAAGCVAGAVGEIGEGGGVAVAALQAVSHKPASSMMGRERR